MLDTNGARNTIRTIELERMQGMRQVRTRREERQRANLTTRLQTELAQMRQMRQHRRHVLRGQIVSVQRQISELGATGQAGHHGRGQLDTRGHVQPEAAQATCNQRRRKPRLSAGRKATVRQFSVWKAVRVGRIDCGGGRGRREARGATTNNSYTEAFFNRMRTSTSTQTGTGASLPFASGLHTGISEAAARASAADSRCTSIARCSSALNSLTPMRRRERMVRGAAGAAACPPAAATAAAASALLSNSGSNHSSTVTLQLERDLRVWPYQRDKYPGP